MKNNKFRIVLVISLICTLVMSTSISVLAKSNTISKPSMQISTYSPYSNKHAGQSCFCTFSCKGSKKIEIYRSSTKSGKYKKYVTTKANSEKYKSVGNGLYFYKARGINGDNKGKFCSPKAAFKTDISLTGSTVNYYDESIILRYSVDNTNSKNDMVFYNNESRFWAYVDLKHGEFSYAYIDEYGDYIDKNGYWINNCPELYGMGMLCDSNGDAIKTRTIKAGKTGYVYMKYTIEEGDMYEDEENYKAASKLFNSALSSAPNRDYTMTIILSFKVKSGDKSYKFTYELGVFPSDGKNIESGSSFS